MESPWTCVSKPFQSARGVTLKFVVELIVGDVRRGGVVHVVVKGSCVEAPSCHIARGMPEKSG